MSTLKVDTVRPVTTNGSLTLQGDSSGAGVTGITINSSGVADFLYGLTANSGADYIGEYVVDASYTDAGAVGGTPSAVLYGDGTIVGTTDNGEYIKYPSGVMICWFYDVVTDQAISSSYGLSLYQGTRTWTYPALFSTGTTPSVTCGLGKWGVGAAWSGVDSATSSSATLRFWDVTSRASGTSMDISAMAIGYWS